MESLGNIALLLALLVREVGFRFGPPALIVVVAVLASSVNQKKRGLSRAAILVSFLILFVGWQFVVAFNPEWTSGWYRE
jgi:hypothetical protein